MIFLFLDLCKVDFDILSVSNYWKDLCIVDFDILSVSNYWNIQFTVCDTKLYYSKNVRKTTESFWSYYPDMPKSGHGNNVKLRQKIIYPIKDSESFNYKTKLVGNVPGVADSADGDDIERELKDIKIDVPLKNISNFIFNLDFLLINSEIELILKWTEDCVSQKKQQENLELLKMVLLY